jgi:putative photosynthetic complex assembly protein 2
MGAISLAAGFAMLVWWFTTGIILYLDGLPRSTFRWSMLGATAVLGLALVALRQTAVDATTASSAYVAFLVAIAIWGWLEMSFLMGFITGPRKHACPASCGGARHFMHGAEVLIYNELATLAAALLVYFATLNAANRVAWWTFLVLWAMRLSAKLNLFFGVPNSGEQFLPPHLQYLKSFFKKRRLNLLFPLSVAGATVADVLLAQRCLHSNEPFQITAYALVATLLALALLEHWFMVLPVPTEKLWAWSSEKFAGARSASRSQIARPAFVRSGGEGAPRIVVKAPT